MIGIDADYAMHRTFVFRGWPAFVVVDPEGVVRFHGFDPDRQLSGLRRCLQELLAQKPAAPDPKQALDCGIAFPAEVLSCRQAPRERSPRLAFDRSGNAFVVYYSNREGTNAVCVRRFNPKGEKLADDRVSPASAEAYAPDCAVDPAGSLWVTWCAKRGRFYDVFAQSRRDGQEPVTHRLTISDDDAMSPKVAAGPDGRVTVTYYRWAMMRGVSRDRNIFARTFEPARAIWGAELQVSPPEPAVEDHTDPDVVVDRQGNAWVAWSFDYHSSLYKKPVEAEQPTIFAARLGSNSVSAPLLVGATGQFRYAIDLFPSAALDSQGSLWCAWDCSEPRRCIRLAQLNETVNTFKLVSTFGGKGEVCSTPELSPATAGHLLLAWSQRGSGGPWQGKVALLKAGQAIATVTLDEKADVLLPQPQQGPDGQFWVAYEKSAPRGSEIVLRNVTRELESARARAAAAN